MRSLSSFTSIVALTAALAIGATGALTTGAHASDERIQRESAGAGPLSAPQATFADFNTPRLVTITIRDRDGTIIYNNSRSMRLNETFRDDNLVEREVMISEKQEQTATGTLTTKEYGKVRTGTEVTMAPFAVDQTPPQIKVVAVVRGQASATQLERSTSINLIGPTVAETNVGGVVLSINVAPPQG